MPLRYLQSLSKAERMALPAMRRAVREGVSATEALAAFRRGGGRIRDARWYEGMRRVQRELAMGSQLKFLPLNVAPDPRRLPLAMTRILREYSFFVELHGTEIATGQRAIQTITVSLDAPRKRRVIEEMALKAWETQAKKYGMRDVTAMLVHGIRRAEEEEEE